MDTTIIQQGSFTSDGTAKTLALRSDVDWIKTYNLATLTAPGAGTGIEFEWFRGFPQDSAIEYKKTAATDAMAPSVIAVGGITLLDTSVYAASAPVALTAISNALPGIVTTAVPWGFTLNNGDIVRFNSVVGGRQLGGMDFTVGNVAANASFSLINMPSIVAVAAPGALAVWRRIDFDKQWYPPMRYISKITQAVQAVVTTTVDHTFTVGQELRMTIPNAYGMTQLNNQQVVVLAITQHTFTINVNTLGYTPFAFPTTGAAPFTPAVVTPIGEAAIEQAPLQLFANLVDDATTNLSLIGVRLAAGVDSPAGVNTNQIYWVAGKSFSVTNI